MKSLRWPLAVVMIMASLGMYHWVGAQDAHSVVKVFDGDTILLDDGRKVRLIGVDAPEVDSPYSKAEPFGEESRDYLKGLISGQKVMVKTGKELYDRYGRTLGYVYAGNVLVNGRIIRDGWARVYVRFDYSCKDLFLAYEQEARSKGIGIWKGQPPDTKDRKKKREPAAL